MGIKILVLWLFSIAAGVAVAASVSQNNIINPGLEKRINDQPFYEREYATPLDATYKTYANHDSVITSLEEAKHNFKAWFNLSIQNSDQLVDAAGIMLAEYYERLRGCQRGTYHYPEPNPFFGWVLDNDIQPKYFFTTAKILGQENDRCVVDITMMKRNSIVHRLCQYSQNTLSFFSDQEARKAARHNIYYKGKALQDFKRSKEECQIKNRLATQ